MRMTHAFMVLAAFALAGALAAEAGQTAAKPDKPDNAKVLGTWAVEVYADGQSFYLTLLVEETEGKLTAKASEQYGMFTDAPASDVSYDGTLLKMALNVPSPPDGLARPWAVEAKIGEDVMEGVISNAELMISAGVTGKRTKK
ncbi:MAG: hypothetical protein FJY79_08075 [Candidatus Aminicenantes bacterium]|nr:hypothetical protein [Candidatus Aminicenantes bacterium]